MNPPKAKWTNLTYIAAHNNLQDFGMRSWRQIVSVGSTPQVVHGVLFDGHGGASRYVIGGPGKQLVKEDFPSFDSGDPDRLIETANWLFQKYPAENYGLVLWSHGTGWQPNEIEQIARQVRGDQDVSESEADQRSLSTPAPALFRTSMANILERPSDQRAILFDDGSQHSLDTLELHRVVQTIAEQIDAPLQLLGMDACLMSSIEVAYELRDPLRFMVASEELVPAESWPYDVIFGKLRDNPDLSGRDLAELIPSEYEAYYRQKDLRRLGADVTKAAFDLSQIETVSASLKNLSETLLAEMEAAAPALWQSQIACRETERHYRQQSKFDLHLWDILSLVSSLAAQAGSPKLQDACQAVIQAMQPGGAILKQVHLGSWFDAIGGASVYLPVPIESPRVTEFYPDLQFAQDTGWDQMLNAYHTAARRPKTRMR